LYVTERHSSAKEGDVSDLHLAWRDASWLQLRCYLRVLQMLLKCDMDMIGYVLESHRLEALGVGERAAASIVHSSPGREPGSVRQVVGRAGTLFGPYGKATSNCNCSHPVSSKSGVIGHVSEDWSEVL
jgi:hypothetical protein